MKTGEKVEKEKIEGNQIEDVPKFSEPYQSVKICNHSTQKKVWTSRKQIL